ncbi:MAG: sporulation transcriptional regulator SpoIIID [Candidatus Merdivicinus sp.]
MEISRLQRCTQCLAKFFGQSWTPADITERLRHTNPQLYHEVRKILDINKEERHIRGGMATKHKYELLNK